jgi:hypothetical protein
MIDLNNFLTGQQEVYGRLERNLDVVRRDGTTPPKTAQERDGYLVILRHPEEIVDRCTDFSRKIAQIVPALVYEGTAVHTTLAVINMNYRAADVQSKDEASVRILENALHRVAGNFRLVQFQYNGWLFDTGTTLAQGIADASFVALANEIHGSLEARAVAEHVGKIQQPWGGHITVSRFLELTPGDQMEGYFDLVRREPALLPSVPKVVNLAYVSVKRGILNMDVLAEFPLIR